jgi:hypothetical protein
MGPTEEASLPEEAVFSPPLNLGAGPYGSGMWTQAEPAVSYEGIGKE